MQSFRMGTSVCGNNNASSRLIPIEETNMPTTPIPQPPDPEFPPDMPPDEPDLPDPPIEEPEPDVGPDEAPAITPVPGVEIPPRV